MKKRTNISVVVFTLITVFFVAFTGNDIYAGMSKQIKQAIKDAAKVSDDVPVKALDDAVDPSLTKSVAKELENAEDALNPSAAKKTVDELDASNDALVRSIEKSLGKNLSDDTIRALKSDREGLETAVTLARGVENVTENIPDLARRIQFFKTANGDTICVLARYDDLVRDAVKVEDYISLGKLNSPQGWKALSFDDFGNYFKKTGEAGYQFWKTSVQPHWKLWAGGTALAALMIAPEQFIDGAGNLTEEGTRNILNFGGELLLRVVEPIPEVVKEKKEELKKEVKEIKEEFKKDIEVLDKEIKKDLKFFILLAVKSPVFYIVLVTLIVIFRKKVSKLICGCRKLMRFLSGKKNKQQGSIVSGDTTNQEK